MKKAPKKNLKLEIHRETLRTLEPQQLLVGIEGGYNYSTLSNCTQSCATHC